MADVPTQREDFAARMLDSGPLGIGPDGEVASFPLSELAARTKQRDADEQMIEQAIAEAFGDSATS